MAIATIKKLPHSMVEISGEISAEAFEKERKAAVTAIGQSVHIPGFRPGKIPEALLVEKFGEQALLHEMAERAIAKAYPDILAEQSLETLGRPEVNITKLEAKQPITFTVTTAVMPEVTLPDYLTLAKAAMTENLGETVVEEKEIDDVIAEIQKMRTAPEATEAPVFDDAFVASLGNFKDVADFKAKVRSNIQLEKEIKLRDKRRATALERIAEGSKTELPAILVDTEVARMLAELRGEIARAGGTFEAYCTERGKTEEDIRREMRPSAEKRVTYELVLKEIGKKEKLIVSEEELARESEHILAEYKGADPERVGLYVEGLLMNEKVLQFLEAQK